MTIHQGYDHLPLGELAARLQGEPGETEEAEGDASAYYMDIAQAIARHGEAGIALLLEEFSSVESDEARLRGVLGGLALQRMPETQYPPVQAIFRRLLGDARPFVVCDAIAGLAANQDVGAMNAVQPLGGHPSGWVRAGVLRYVQGCAPAQAVSSALAALDDQDAIVRACAVDVLDELGAAGDHLDQIRPLLQDTHPDVRAAAEWALEAAEETRHDED